MSLLQYYESSRYKFTGFNLAYVLEAPKLIIIGTREGGGARLARARESCSSVATMLGRGRLESLRGGGTLPLCVPHRQWIVYVERQKK